MHGCAWVCVGVTESTWMCASVQVCQVCVGVCGYACVGAGVRGCAQMCACVWVCEGMH